MKERRGRPPDRQVRTTHGANARIYQQMVFGCTGNTYGHLSLGIMEQLGLLKGQHNWATEGATSGSEFSSLFDDG